MAKAKKARITSKEFARRFEVLTEKHLGGLPLEEQKTRLAAAERRLSKILSDRRPTVSRTQETPVIPLSTRSRHGER